MLAVLVAVLCLVAVSLSAPVPCEDLTQTLDPIDGQQMQGRWALVASAMKDPGAAAAMKRRDSVTVDIGGGSYNQANRFVENCQYQRRNLTLEGAAANLEVPGWTFTATLLKMSCPDCLALRLVMDSPAYKSENLYLLSRRREVSQEEMERFTAQVGCLNLPAPHVMDASKELCPEEPAQE